MGRSPFTLAAAVTAALPGAEVTGTRTLTTGDDGRFDSAVASLSDGRELAIRVAENDEGTRELATEALALRALTAGARSMLPFRAPEYIGETRLGDALALVTGLLPGFQIEAGMVPAVRGAAASMGAAIAAVHSMPSSVVRGAGLITRSAQESRDEVGRVVDDAAATGRMPARLTTRWREAVADDDLWRFESTVVLGGVQATSFLFADDPQRRPEVTGLVGWHSLSMGDPAIDLSWLTSAPGAAADVHAAYAQASDRVPDPALEVRARLLAELEFARWLVHGDSLHRPDIVDDAAALLGALAKGLRGNDLTVLSASGDGVDSAMDALDRVPADAVAGVDTSMQTDAYNPGELWPEEIPEAESPAANPDAEAAHRMETDEAANRAKADESAHRAEMLDIETEDLSAVRETPMSSARAATTPANNDPDLDSDEETQRAARAALQRWKSSSSE